LPYFAEGDEFVVEHIGVRPEGFFCDWAWNDIHKLLLAMQLGGDFSPWMKDERTFIACCTDGVKPVVFKLERIDQDPDGRPTLRAGDLSAALRKAPDANR